MDKSEILGKQVKWSMVELSGVMIQSADLSIKHSEKLYKGVSGITEAAVAYDPVGEFSINAVMLNDTDVDAVEATLKTWCTTEATKNGLATGGSVIITDRKISQKIEDAQTVDFTAKYLPYCVSSEA